MGRLHRLMGKLLPTPDASKRWTFSPAILLLKLCLPSCTSCLGRGQRKRLLFWNTEKENTMWLEIMWWAMMSLISAIFSTKVSSNKWILTVSRFSSSSKTLTLIFEALCLIQGTQVPKRIFFPTPARAILEKYVNKNSIDTTNNIYCHDNCKQQKAKCNVFECIFLNYLFLIVFMLVKR